MEKRNAPPACGASGAFRKGGCLFAQKLNFKAYWICRNPVSRNCEIRPKPGSTVVFWIETAFARLVVGFPEASRNSGLAAVFTAWKLSAGISSFWPTAMDCAEYCGWLKRLKNSNRNCILMRSVSLKFLFRDQSTVLVPGPEQIPTADLTNFPNWKPFKV